MHNSCLTTRRLAAGLLALLAVLVLSACDDKASPVATADSNVGTDGAAGSDAGATDAAAASDVAASDTSASDTASDGLVQGDAATDVIAQTDAGGTDAQADTANTDATADTASTDAFAQTDGSGTTDASAGTDAGPQNPCAGAADNTLCDDGNPCTKGDLCTAGSCAGAALNCDDDNACTVDSCKDGVCVHAPLGLPGPPAACDDGNPCTLGDGCQNGACQSGEVVCECSKTADCGKFEDGNLCNGTLFCNLGTGKCQVAPSSVVVCDTSSDTACSQNTCVQLTGACTLTAVSDGLPCSDGNTCTAGDACSSGSCSPGTNTCLCTNDGDCDSQEDGNACNGTLFCNKSNGQSEREYWLANRRRLLDKFGSLCRKVAWDSTDLQAMFMPNGATYVLARRIVSFLFLTSFGSSGVGAMDDGMGSDDETQDLQSLSALRHHLTAFGDLYTSLWLKWVEKTNGRKLLGRLINRVLSDVRGDSADGPGATAFLPFRDWYDLQDVVVDDCEILVPIREKILEESVPALEYKPAKALQFSLQDLVVSSMIFNQRLLGKGEEEIAARQAAVAAQFAKAGTQGTQSPGTVPGSSGTGKAMEVSKTTGQGGQVGSIYQWEAAQAKQASTTQQAWVNKPIDSELVTKYSLLQIDLGDPTSMAQSSSVEVVAEGMYVKGRFDAC